MKLDEKMLKELSQIERSILPFLLNEKKTIGELSAESEMQIDSVRRAVAWLNQKGLAKVFEEKTSKLKLSSDGVIALKKGMPENIFLKSLKNLDGKATFKEIEKESELSKKEFQAALGINKKKAFITIINGEISETGVAEEINSFEKRNLLQDVADSKKISVEDTKELIRRGLIEQENFVEREVSSTPFGEVAKEYFLKKGNRVERVFDVSAPVPNAPIGKRVPYIQFLSQMRSKLVELGFKEMETPLVSSEFYNFDVLFQPQNHPARAWTDTYQLKNPSKGKLPSKKIVSAIKKAHEDGGKSNSSGWGYNWCEDVASKLMPVAHGTAHSARQLVEGVESPGKYFAIARCFRPDVLDSTHLIEFNQLEGFIVGKDLNFRHLLGMLKDFAIEFAGAEDVKFFPDYYPFTEPSVQLSAKHPKLGWVEFAGAGMFRPEMLENLGIKGEAIAWGMGIDRLAMFKLGIKDIRELFSQDLGYLRKAKGAMI